MFQLMTKEVRCLFRGLALAYGSAPDTYSYHKPNWDAESLDLDMLETEINLVSELHPDARVSSFDNLEQVLVWQLNT